MKKKIYKIDMIMGKAQLEQPWVKKDIGQSVMLH